jgi:hypothetical protein
LVEAAGNVVSGMIAVGAEPGRMPQPVITWRQRPHVKLHALVPESGICLLFVR